jgi:hypothetical protein
MPKCLALLVLGVQALVSIQLAQAQVMSVPGQFAVSPSGAATYAVPIQLPPGAAGMEPRLALVYNSQAGNGLAGLGWSLSGLSAVSRCPRTMAQDGARGGVSLDANDRFCLDGQRLILVAGAYGAAGSEYRTEMEGFARITYDGSGFVVQSKAGLTSEYGKTDDSRIEAQGKSAARVWAVSKMSDVAGNYMTYSYAEDNANGDYRIAAIAYTGNTNTGQVAENRVVFGYESRGDGRPMYLLGSKVQVLQRFSAITTFVNTSRQVLQYRIGYSTDTTTLSQGAVSSVTVVNALGQALPSTMFNYSGSTVANWSAPATQANLHGVGGAGGGRFVDLNGDGLPDYVTKNWDSTIHWNMNRGTGIAGSQWEPNQSQSGLHGAGNAGLWFIDINGDGLTDYVTKNNDGTIHWNLGAGTGIEGTQWQANESQSGLHGAGAAGMWFVDINSDGLPDYVTKNRDGTIHWNLNLGTGVGGSQWGPNQSQAGLHGAGAAGIWFIDINGDGLIDYVTKNSDGSILWNLGTGTGVAGTQWLASQSQSGLHGVGNFGGARFVDINGDGLPDYVTTYRDENLDTTVSWNLNLGGGGSANQWGANQSQFLTGGGGLAGSWFVDINGDGLPDFVTKNYDGALYWSLGTGTGVAATQWKATQVQTGLHGVGNAGMWFEDINGDGLPDYVTKNSDGNIHWDVSSAQLFKLASIDSGVGTRTAISLSRYAGKPQASARYPLLSLPRAMLVVSRVSTTNGAGGTNSTSYGYDGLLAELGTGRGMLGFKSSDILEEATGVRVYTDYRQDWPYTGLPLKSETYFLSPETMGPFQSFTRVGQLLRRTLTTYGCKTGDGSDCQSVPGNCNLASNTSSCTGISSARVFPYAATVIEQSWDLNGVAQPTMTSTSSYNLGADAQYWGDVSAVDVQTSDGLSSSRKTVSNDYYPALTSSGKWIAGRLKRSTATSTLTAP